MDDKPTVVGCGADDKGRHVSICQNQSSGGEHKTHPAPLVGVPHNQILEDLMYLMPPTGSTTFEDWRDSLAAEFLGTPEWCNTIHPDTEKTTTSLPSQHEEIALDKLFKFLYAMRAQRMSMGLNEWIRCCELIRTSEQHRESGRLLQDARSEESGAQMALLSQANALKVLRIARDDLQNRLDKALKEAHQERADHSLLEDHLEQANCDIQRMRSQLEHQTKQVAQAQSIASMHENAAKEAELKLILLGNGMVRYRKRSSPHSPPEVRRRVQGVADVIMYGPREEKIEHLEGKGEDEPLIASDRPSSQDSAMCSDRADYGFVIAMIVTTLALLEEVARIIDPLLTTLVVIITELLAYRTALWSWPIVIGGQT